MLHRGTPERLRPCYVYYIKLSEINEILCHGTGAGIGYNFLYFRRLSAIIHIEPVGTPVRGCRKPGTFGAKTVTSLI